MMKRRTFLQNTALAGAGLFVNHPLANSPVINYPKVRKPLNTRNFTSKAIEDAINTFTSHVKDRELAWLFENCFPNTLDTTVFFEMKDGVPDTYVITGDIDAMWLRDSSAQVWPYLEFVNQDIKLKQLIAGVINRQVECILRDPYANAFYKDPEKTGEWAKDLTEMKPGVHERKWEIDSLCYPVRLAYHYWKSTGDTSPFNDRWAASIRLIYKVFREQQRKNGPGSYRFQRTTPVATDTLPMSGYGYPVNPVGLICSSFRPSDDATVFSFLIPSNFFAVVSLKQAAEMMDKIGNDHETSENLLHLASEVEQALKVHAVVHHEVFGDIYAYEVNGFGSYNLMDDANIPSLLSLPYLEAVDKTDPVYLNTRKFVLSRHNPFFFKGQAGEGIGGPHVGMDMIWPLSIIMRGLTSEDSQEKKQCIEMLKNSHGGTGFMHESFYKDDATKFTRSWFAWANTLFGEFLWRTYKTEPQLF
ncbi:MAG TPA: glycoside hydrolase family 125 protein [Bacteroidales bacterium]|nr:glycoside hydrolase family 125 protein [Bacteroidales bacterium]